MKIIAINKIYGKLKIKRSKMPNAPYSKLCAAYLQIHKRLAFLLKYLEIKIITMCKKKEKGKLNTLTNKEIEEAFTYQHDNVGWDFYSEREFIESLFSTRFNYLIVAYSLFVTAFATIKGRTDKLIILYLGLVIITLVSLTIYRAYVKLIINFRILHRLPEKHVFPIINKETKSKKFKLFNVNPIFGWIIPTLLILSFILAIVLITFNCWIV